MGNKKIIGFRGSFGRNDYKRRQTFNWDVFNSGAFALGDNTTKTVQALLPFYVPFIVDN